MSFGSIIGLVRNIPLSHDGLVLIKDDGIWIMGSIQGPKEKNA